MTLAKGRWRVAGVVCEGDPIKLDGINPWDHEWRSLKATVMLPHPTYSDQMHEMSIYEILTEQDKIVLAVDELSADVWGFYVSAE